MSAVPAVVKPAADGWNIYRRLIKYARPHAGMFFIGVLGGIPAFGAIGIIGGPVVLSLVLALIEFAEESRSRIP